MESPTAVGGGRAQNDAAAAERQGTLGSTLSGLVGQDKEPTPTLRVTGNQMDEDEKQRQRQKSEQWAAELRVQMEEQRVQKEKEKQDELERLEAIAGFVPTPLKSRPSPGGGQQLPAQAAQPPGAVSATPGPAQPGPAQPTSMRKRELNGQMGSTLGVMGGSPAAEDGTPARLVRKHGRYVVVDEQEEAQKAASEQLWKEQVQQQQEQQRQRRMVVKDTENMSDYALEQLRKKLAAANAESPSPPPPRPQPQPRPVPDGDQVGAGGFVDFTPQRATPQQSYAPPSQTPQHQQQVQQAVQQAAQQYHPPPAAQTLQPSPAAPMSGLSFSPAATWSPTNRDEYGTSEQLQTLLHDLKLEQRDLRDELRVRERRPAGLSVQPRRAPPPPVFERLSKGVSACQRPAQAPRVRRKMRPEPERREPPQQQQQQQFRAAQEEQERERRWEFEQRQRQQYEQQQAWQHQQQHQYQQQQQQQRDWGHEQQQDDWDADGQRHYEPNNRSVHPIARFGQLQPLPELDGISDLSDEPPEHEQHEPQHQQPERRRPPALEIPGPGPESSPNASAAARVREERATRHRVMHTPPVSPRTLAAISTKLGS